MDTRYFLTAILRVVVLLWLVAACSGGATPTVAPGLQTPPGEPRAPAAQPSPGKTSARPAREQVIRLPASEPSTLDPGLASDSGSLEIIVQIFEGLVGVDDDGKVYGVHADRWEVSPDGTTYTFHLRPGLKWTDGRPITAHDYEWAWKRNIDPRTASDYATTMYPVKNAVKIHTAGMSPDQLGVTATDDSTLVVTLEQPAAFFLKLVSTWTFFPLPRWTIERNGPRWTEAANIVTNGPFKLDRWDHEQEIVLVRNEDYWGTKPALQKAIYNMFPEGGPDSSITAYEAGEIDVGGIPSSHLDRVLNDPVLKDQVHIFPESGTFFVVVNNRRDHLKDPRVRKALGMVIERDRIVNRILRTPSTPAFSLQPEGIAGRRPEIWPRENVDEAKRLLAEAGYPDGQGFPELVFTQPGGRTVLGEYLQQRWKETLGINVRLETMDQNVFLQWRRTPDWERNGDLYMQGWLSDYEDPNNWYNVLWDSREDRGQFNTGWKNDEYDRIVRQAQGELDAQKREQLYAQAEAILAQEYPVIPLWHPTTRLLLKPYIQGYQPSRLLGFTPLRNIVVLEH